MLATHLKEQLERIKTRDESNEFVHHFIQPAMANTESGADQMQDESKEQELVLIEVQGVLNITPADSLKQENINIGEFDSVKVVQVACSVSCLSCSSAQTELFIKSRQSYLLMSMDRNVCILEIIYYMVKK